MKNDMKTGIELIAEERKEQIEKHGRSISQDVEFNTNYELAWAASLLTTTPDQDIDVCSDLIILTRLKNWNKEILSRMVNKPYKERLIIAGAFIAAEIDRIQARRRVNPQSHERIR